MSRSRVLTVAFLIGLAAALWGLSREVGRVECRVCMGFEGRRSCATAAAETRDEAFQSARRTACATIASGVRDTMACGAAEPAEQVCRGG